MLFNLFSRRIGNIFRNIRFQSSINTPLTKDRYPVKRGNFAELTETDVKYFQSILSKERCLSDSSEIESYNRDFNHVARGCSQLLLRPKTTEEVSEILKYCNAKKLAVCPQGGNTGLVGGSVPVFDEIILSTQLMNKIEHSDPVSGIMECQSGCILEQLDQFARQKGLIMPLDLGAKGTCHIGGNVSTNAGGLRLLRYGNLHGSVTGVEAVKADGTILNLMSHFKKDNTGYHLKHLFIGSEGTLGVVTKVAIACPTASKAVNVAFIGLPNFDSVLKTFVAAKEDLGEILSSCEMIDNASLDASVTGYNLKCPIGDYPFYMLLETSGSKSEHDEEKLHNFLNNGMENGDILDGTIANDKQKMDNIWKLREFIPTGLIKNDYVFKYDLSLPYSNFYDIVLETRKHANKMVKKVCGYGHIGDSNLHLNISCDQFTDEIKNHIEQFIYKYTAKVNGSISAEHGIGFLKTKYVKYSKTAESLALMRELKNLMDPNGILNPYKVLN